MSQPDLFGGKPATPAAYVPKARHVRNRFIDFLAEMTAAKWKAKLEAEAARLDEVAEPSR